MNIEQFLKTNGLDTELTRDRLSTAVKPNEYVHIKFGDHRGETLEGVYFSKNEPEGFEGRAVHLAVFHGGHYVES